MISYLFFHAKPPGGREEEKRHSHNFLEGGEDVEEQKSVGGGNTFAPHSSVTSSEIMYRHNTQDFSKGQGCRRVVWLCSVGAERREERWASRFYVSPYQVSWLLSTC